MSDAGRPRLPSAVKEAQGTLEKSRSSAREPNYPAGSTLKPPLLEGPAAMEYLRLSKLLRSQGLFPETAEGLLALGCWWYGVWAESTVLIELHGQITASDNGRLFANPAVEQAAKASAHYETICGRFGLDPASMGKVTARPEDEEGDELAKKREARRAER